MLPRSLRIAPTVALLLVAMAAACATDAVDPLSAPLARVSHIAPRLRRDGLSQLAAHLRRLPPSALTAPMSEGNGSVVKGFDPEMEAALAGDLVALNLRHPILRVAIASYHQQRLALIKLQAGTQHARSFDAQALQEDAVAALNAAFALTGDMECVDLWAVVPSTENLEYGHIPVFSVTARREAFTSALSQPRTAPQVLSRLGVVRFSPEYTLFGATPNSQALGLLPDERYDLPPASANWPGLVLECEQRLARENGRPASLFESVRTGQRVAALTIDDGPHPLTTPLMLAVLKHYGVHATFFLVGQKVEEYPELVRMIDRDGHEIGNHAYTNRRAGDMTGPQILAELTACQNAVLALTGKRTRFFRPPGGRLTEDGLHAVAISDLTLAMWTNNADDWLKPAPEVIARNVLTGLEPGGVILMHQGSMESFQALPMIIEGARARGLELAGMGDVRSAGSARITQSPPSDLLAYLRKMGYRHD
jgi:peptidoglycan/xylan/chitin deacetylase (PgdA/CDA1 family)